MTKYRIYTLVRGKQSRTENKSERRGYFGSLIFVIGLAGCFAIVAFLSLVLGASASWPFFVCFIYLLGWGNYCTPSPLSAERVLGYGRLEVV